MCMNIVPILVHTIMKLFPLILPVEYKRTNHNRVLIEHVKYIKEHKPISMASINSIAYTMSLALSKTLLFLLALYL